MAAEFLPRPHHRHVSGVIGDAVLLLVGGLVLLIDHDRPQAREGQEKRRARARHHPDLALRDAAPDPRPATRRNAGMPFRRPLAESRGETVEKLPRQRNFRHQDQSLSAGAQSLGDGLEIDFRLAGAGDAFEQDRFEMASRDGLPEGLRGLILRGGKVRGAEIGIGPRARRFGRKRDRLQRAVVDQRVDDAGRHAGEPRQLGFGRREIADQGGKHALGARASAVSAWRRSRARRCASARPPRLPPRASPCAAPCRAGPTSRPQPNRERRAVFAAAAAGRAGPKRA